MRLESVFSGLSQAKFPGQDVPLDTSELSRELLAIGICVLTYEAVSKLVDKIASETLNRKRVSLWISACSFVYVYQMKLPVMQGCFIAICIFYVVVSIWSAWKSSDIVALPNYMVDMVAEAKEGAYIPKIGYEEAVQSVEVLINTKKKSNAVLLANPGVGKSTIPETIAHKIATDQYPARSPFFKAKLMRVDFADLMSGTIYRGTLEQRVCEMVQLAKRDPKIIYFIDEIQNLVGGGQSAESRVDVSAMLLPVMARGEIRILGASTVEDYNNCIAPKEPFARRLPSVTIEEPSHPKCYEMLKHSYSQLSGRIKISDQAIAAAIVSSIDIPKRYFPDKAIEIIDYAISRAELELDETENDFILTERHIAEAVNLKGILPSVEKAVEQFTTFISKNPKYFSETKKI